MLFSQNSLLPSFCGPEIPVSGIHLYLGIGTNAFIHVILNNNWAVIHMKHQVFGVFSNHVTLQAHFTAPGLLWAPINKSSQEEISPACGIMCIASHWCRNSVLSTCTYKWWGIFTGRDGMPLILPSKEGKATQQCLHISNLYPHKWNRPFPPRLC